MRRCRFLLAACLLFGAMASIATAETIDYTELDLRGPDVEFVGVTEDSITDDLPLFGEPTLAGNSLVFNPSSFEAFSEDGGVDLTDSSLTMEIVATGELGISAIDIIEAGDYSLGGDGTNETFLQAAAPVFVQIVEVDRQSIDPILIVEALRFTPSDGIFSLLDDQNGAGIVWEGHLTIDLDAALAEHDVEGFVTRVLLNMDNSLIAVSEPGSLAFVKKKTARIVITPSVPEPSSIVLACLGLLALAGRLWRRRER